MSTPWVSASGPTGDSADRCDQIGAVLRFGLGRILTPFDLQKDATDSLRSKPLWQESRRDGEGLETKGLRMGPRGKRKEREKRKGKAREAGEENGETTDAQMTTTAVWCRNRERRRELHGWLCAAVGTFNCVGRRQFEVSTFTARNVPAASTRVRPRLTDRGLVHG